MTRVGRRQLAELVSARAEVSAAIAHRVLTEAFQVITEELAKGNSVIMTGFGSWRTKVYKPRAGVNPRHGNRIEIPARTRVQFRAGSSLRKLVETSVDSTVFFGDDTSLATEIDAVLSDVFGDGAVESHLEDAAERIHALLTPEVEREAEKFFDMVDPDDQREGVDEYGEEAAKPTEDPQADVTASDEGVPAEDDAANELAPIELAQLELARIELAQIEPTRDEADRLPETTEPGPRTEA
jgi:DNA-binding protein HU-beta